MKQSKQYNKYFLHNSRITALQLSEPYLQTQQYFQFSKCRRFVLTIYVLLMAGKCQLPSREEMLKNIEETDEKRKETYYGSVRNA
jgi:hypothetical protein